jgi:hypothetical protein
MRLNFSHMKLNGASEPYLHQTVRFFLHADFNDCYSRAYKFATDCFFTWWWWFFLFETTRVVGREVKLYQWRYFELLADRES